MLSRPGHGPVTDNIWHGHMNNVRIEVQQVATNDARHAKA